MAFDAGVDFEGEFRPPAMARVVAPINVAGYGRITVRDDGLEVHASKTKSLGPIMLLVFAVLFVVAIWSSMKLGSRSNTRRGWWWRS